MLATVLRCDGMFDWSVSTKWFRFALLLSLSLLPRQELHHQRQVQHFLSAGFNFVLAFTGILARTMCGLLLEPQWFRCSFCQHCLLLYGLFLYLLWAFPVLTFYATIVVTNNNLSWQLNSDVLLVGFLFHGWQEFPIVFLIHLHCLYVPFSCVLLLAFQSVFTSCVSH